MVFRCSRFRKMCVKVISHMLFVRCNWHVKIVTLHKRLFWSLKAHSFKAYSSSLIWRGYWIGNSENNIIIKTNISFFPSERHQQASATLFKFNGLKLSRTRKSQNTLPVEKKTLLKNKAKPSKFYFETSYYPPLSSPFGQVTRGHFGSWRINIGDDYEN